MTVLAPEPTVSLLALALSQTRPTAARPTPSSLRLVATDLARRTELWRPYVRFDHDQRHYAPFARTDAYEAWVLTWLPGQSTGWHDHGGSAGVFTTVEGILHERTVRGDAVLDRFVPAGGVRAFPAEHVHDVAPSGGPAVSIHVYAPALSTMTRYTLTDGRLVVTGRDSAGLDW